MNSNLEFYNSILKKYSEELEVVRKRNHKLSLMRLLFFMLTIIALIVGWSLKLDVVAYIIALVTISFFVYLCIIHGKSQKRALHLENLIVVTNRYISRINGDFNSLPDKGDEFNVPDHDYAGDLDLFGNVSLFALYNISATAWGRKAFAQELLGDNKYLSHEDIVSRQKACAELIDRPEMLLEYEASAMEGKSHKMPEALLNLSSTEEDASKISLALVRFLPTLWLIPLVLFFINNPYAGASCLLVAIVNLIVWFLGRSEYVELLRAVDGISRQVNSIASLYTILEKENLKDELLVKLIHSGSDKDKLASDGLSQLAKACSIARLREQPILALIFNSVYPLDIYCGIRLNKWAKNYGGDFRENLNSLALIESLMCSSCVGLVSPNSVFPVIRNCEPNDSANAYFSGEMITHPLINPEKVVSNSITLDGKTALITGSNMSGKTTLIRTVGICSLLAYMGAPVPALSVELGRMRIMSSMRIVDSIEEQMSTFRAELVRIAGIVKAADEKMPMLYLIDEIFRGTNSKDRTDGAMTVLTKLAQPYIIGMMTTHDYALCDMSETQLTNIVYYHFSERYDDNGITFDYKLKNGVSHESNASFLMKLVGIK